MNKILKYKLLKIQNDMNKEILEIKQVFLNEDISNNIKEGLIKYNKEKAIMKKYRKNYIEILDYIADLEFSERELSLILHHT